MSYYKILEDLNELVKPHREYYVFEHQLEDQSDYDLYIKLDNKSRFIGTWSYSHILSEYLALLITANEKDNKA